ncbi:MAG: hypothetical protein WD048_01005 [Chitinophagales bacterium]
MAQRISHLVRFQTSKSTKVSLPTFVDGDSPDSNKSGQKEKICGMTGVFFYCFPLE